MDLLKPTLLMLAGLPTSGKSTFVENYINEHLTAVKYATVISTDYYIDYYAKVQKRTYNEVFAEFVKTANREMNDCLKFAIANGKDIIWDQTNLTVKARKAKLARIPDTYTKRAAYFPITLEEALRRNQTRPGKVIPEHVIENMHKTIEIPTLAEGFTNVEIYHAKT